MIPLEVIALSPYAPELLARYGRRRSGRRFRDDHGRAVDVGDWQPQDWDGLLAMYSSLDPAQRTHGLPPLTEQQQAIWLDKLLGQGLNVVARAGTRVVGHAALVTYDGGATSQLVLFVHQDYQNAGIGGALGDALLRVVRRRGAEKISDRWARALTPILSSIRVRLHAVSAWRDHGAPPVAHMVADLDDADSQSAA